MLRLISAIVLCCGSAVVCLPQQLAAQTSTTTANFKPLSKGTVFLYYRSYSSSDYGVEHIGPGLYRPTQSSYSYNGYYYSKVIGDTLIAGQKYGIVYSPRQFVDNTGEYSPTIEFVLERSTPSSIYQYKSNKDELIFDTSAMMYPLIFESSPSRLPAGDCSVNRTDNTINFACQYAMSFGGAFHSDTMQTKSASFKNGYGLYQQSYKYSWVEITWLGGATVGFGRNVEDRLQFIGAISDGKVWGDSLILVLNTDSNVFAKVNLSLPPNISTTVGQVIEIPIILSGWKRFIELTGVKANLLTSTLSFNASMLEPVENTPVGSVANGIRRIPLSFNVNPQNDSAIVSLRFRVAIGNSSQTDLVLDTLRSPNNITIRQKTINGAFQVKGLNYAGKSPALFFSRKAVVALSVKPNPVADNLNISFMLDKASVVELVLTSADGRRIASMTSNIPSDGLHEVVWNAKTQDGSAISSGTYFLQLFVDGHCAAETSLIKTR